MWAAMKLKKLESRTSYNSTPCWVCPWFLRGIYHGCHIWLAFHFLMPPFSISQWILHLINEEQTWLLSFDDPRPLKKILREFSQGACIIRLLQVDFWVFALPGNEMEHSIMHAKKPSCQTNNGFDSLGHTCSRPSALNHLKKWHYNGGIPCCAPRCLIWLSMAWWKFSLSLMVDRGAAGDIKLVKSYQLPSGVHWNVVP